MKHSISALLLSPHTLAICEGGYPILLDAFLDNFTPHRCATWSMTSAVTDFPRRTP
ncbi:hypothetical protein MXF29_13280 [Pseudomonas sp. NC26]|uniref:hypothetical protein n=1 Tax=Pseudomonas TaxID=286 RepID=UPI0018618B28|nr:MULTISPECIES: hypothetical protein [Pseudomonas]MCZ9637550.1 hypothetical protein [Pseudomonas putida]MEC4876569.1 hypothetical protein [Pseudomonas sp. NC26]QNL88049.1 Uncharacterized protein PPKH_2635 [Pseudomonas putida]